MTESETQENATSTHSARRHLILLLAVAPVTIFFGAFLLFEMAFGDGKRLTAQVQALPSAIQSTILDPAAGAGQREVEADSAGGAAGVNPLRDAGNRVTWITAAVLVILVCTPGLAFVWWMMGKRLKGGQIWTVILPVALFFAGWMMVWQPTLGDPPRLDTRAPTAWIALQTIHLHLTADLLHKIDPAFHIFAYRLYILCFGVLVAAVLSGIFAACSVLSPFDRKEAGDPRALARRMEQMKQLLYCGSLLLSVAIIFTGVWLNWPANLLPDKSPLQAELASLAQSVTMFWGAIFTALLLSTYVPGALCLRARAHNLATAALRQEASKAAAGEGAAAAQAPARAAGEEAPRLSEGEIQKFLKTNRLLLPFTDQLQRAIAIFAPAMVGPLMSAVTTFTPIA